MRFEKTLVSGSTALLVQIRDWHNHDLLSESEQVGYVTGTVRDSFFVFEHPITAAEWDSDWADIMRTNEHYAYFIREWPATIELYDQNDQLIRAVDCTIRSRAGDAHAKQEGRA